MGRDVDGERWIAEALKVEPGSRDGHFEFARLLLNKGEAALLLHGGDATDAQVHYLLIRAYRESGNPSQAARHADILRLLDGSAPR
jgi:hypothetical protein